VFINSASNLLKIFDIGNIVNNLFKEAFWNGSNIYTFPIIDNSPSTTIIMTHKGGTNGRDGDVRL